MNNYVNVKKMSITLPNELANELDGIASELNQKKSHIIEKALSFYFDYLDESIADKRLDDLRSGKTKTIPAEQVFQQLGI